MDFTDAVVISRSAEGAYWSDGLYNCSDELAEGLIRDEGWIGNRSADDLSSGQSG